nr:hypothetical protein [Tanacetum cinerariifolium]
YSLARKQVSLSSIPQSQLLQLHDPSGHRDVMSKTPNSLYCEYLPVSTKLQSTLRAIVGPSCLAAAAIELSPTSHPCLGALSSILFQGGVLALGISALRLVDGTCGGIVCGGQVCKDKKDGGSGGVGVEETSKMYACIAQCDQVHTLENMVPASATVELPPRKDPHMEYSKIVPQRKRSIGNCGIN